MVRIMWRWHWFPWLLTRVNLFCFETKKSDASLRHCFEKAKSGDFRKAKNSQWQFYVKDQTLFQYFASLLHSVKQLVVPSKYRCTVMITGNDSIFAGHLEMVKTLARIQSQFFWSGISGNIRRFVQTCPECQKMTKQGAARPAPIQSSYLPFHFFERVPLILWVS